MQRLTPRPYQLTMFFFHTKEKETTIQREYLDLIAEASAKWPDWEMGAGNRVCTHSPSGLSVHLTII